MTTKPKTCKASAKRCAPKAATKQATREPKREVSEICRLVARWRWLKADRTYIYAITSPEKEADRLVMSHQKEQKDIEVRLSKLVPKNLWEVMGLLEFATEMVEQGGSDDLEVKMRGRREVGLEPHRRKSKWKSFQKSAYAELEFKTIFL
jgi:hypothetical protein